MQGSRTVFVNNLDTFMQAPTQRTLTAKTTSTGSPQNFSQGPAPDHAKTPKAVKKNGQDCKKRTFYTITSQKPSTRAVTQAPLRHGICKLLTQGPPRRDLAWTSTRSSGPGSTQTSARKIPHDPTRTRPCENLA
jgi:hypothetical protein